MRFLHNDYSKDGRYPDKRAFTRLRFSKAMNNGNITVNLVLLLLLFHHYTRSMDLPWAFRNHFALIN